MEGISSLLIYLLVFIVSIALFNIGNKAKKKAMKIFFYNLALFIPTILAGIRYGIGTDYFTYINAFEKISLGQEVRWESLEVGFWLLNLILANLGFGPQSIIFFSSLITTGFVMKALIRRRDLGFAAFGFATFLFVFYLSTFNTIRLMIAVSLFLYNISNIIDKKVYKYIIFTLIAASFHVTSFITLPLYWIFNFLKLDKNWIRRLTLFFGTAMGVVLLDDILTWLIPASNIEALSYYGKYAENSGSASNLAFNRFLLYIPLVIPGLLWYKSFKKIDKDFTIYFSFLMIGIILKVLTSFYSTYVDRISDYFLISAVMVMPIYIKGFSKKKKYGLYLSLSFYLILFWFSIYFLLENHGTFPYRALF